MSAEPSTVEVETVVMFARIGRTRDVQPLVLAGRPNAHDVAEQVYRYARRFLRSSEVEVIVDLPDGGDAGRVFIQTGGFNNGGDGTLAVRQVAAVFP